MTGALDARMPWGSASAGVTESGGRTARPFPIVQSLATWTNLPLSVSSRAGGYESFVRGAILPVNHQDYLKWSGTLGQRDHWKIGNLRLLMRLGLNKLLNAAYKADELSCFSKQVDVVETHLKSSATSVSTPPSSERGIQVPPWLLATPHYSGTLLKLPSKYGYGMPAFPRLHELKQGSVPRIQLTGHHGYLQSYLPTYQGNMAFTVGVGVRLGR